MALEIELVQKEKDCCQRQCFGSAHLIIQIQVRLKLHLDPDPEDKKHNKFSRRFLIQFSQLLWQISKKDKTTKC